MAKKDFSQMNTAKADTGVNTGRVFDTIERGKDRKGAQPEASKEEQAARAADLRTQGRKGCKLPRINLAFTPENYEYVRVLSKITGQSMTQFINACLEDHRKDHPEVFEQAKAIIDSVRGAKE